MPDFEFERQIEEMLSEAPGPVAVLGLDEVGRGPLAGPVVAAGVVLDTTVAKNWYPDLDDSKKLTAKKRVELNNIIRREAIWWGIAHMSPREIDQYNILQCSGLAMVKVLDDCSKAMDGHFIGAIVDGFNMKRFFDRRSICVDKADSRSMSVAAASIIAKVNRDAYMREAAGRYPGYGFERNKGYPTPQHLEALKKHGPCKIHRRTFGPVKQYEIIE